MTKFLYVILNVLQVFIKTNRFREDQEQYANARTIAFDEPTDDPIRIVKNTKRLLGLIFRKGYTYKKAGVLLIDLIPKGAHQGLLFEEHSNPRQKEFVDVFEEVASKYGQTCAFLGAQGVKQKWSMRREMRTPRYTTSWDEIPVLKG